MGDKEYVYVMQLNKVMKEKGKVGEDLMRVTGHTPANVSRIRHGKIRSLRFTTLFAICDELDCRPGDILDRIPACEADDLEKGVFIINLDNDDQ